MIEKCDHEIAVMPDIGDNVDIVTMSSIDARGLRTTSENSEYAWQFDYCPKCGAKLDWDEIRATHRQMWADLTGGK